MGFWQVTYKGVTKDAADWGISGLARKRKEVATDLVTFRLDGAAFDTSPLPFECFIGTGMAAGAIPQLAITRNGVPWFTGVVTKPKPKAKPNSESIDYEISGPWYWLEKTPFQQQWSSVDLSGGVLTSLTTTQSEVILGQAVNGVKINTGEVIKEVLLYAQYAFQMQPFPIIVTLDNLPPPPNPALGALPFLIGTITPNITVPYIPVKDRSCADVIRLMLKYSPDAVAWVDYSTSPPTINIGQRANLQKKTISVLNGNFVTGFDPQPRYDLQVPVVVVKFHSPVEFDGTSYDSITSDIYPPAPAGVNPEAWASQSLAWVQNIDLLGSHTTQQTADIKVIARPLTAADEVALPWVLKKLPWLTVGPSAGVYTAYDVANISVANIITTIDPDDPLNDPKNNPNNITLPNCPQLVNELLTGAFADWLQEAPNNLDAAKVVIQVDMQYTGSDPLTAALFWYDPMNPGTPKTDGSGLFRFWWPTKVTNAETQKYSQVTSWDGGGARTDSS